MAQEYGIKRTNRTTGTVTGDAATAIGSTSMDNRRGVLIHNPNATYDLWVRLVANGAAAPTITATDRDFVIAQDQTLSLEASEGVDIYIMNSSGAATTSEYCATEVDYAVPTGIFGKNEISVTGSVSLGAEKADDAAFTPATSTVVPIGAFADQTAPDSVDEGDVGAVRMTLDRLLKVTNELESGFMRASGTSATIKFASIAASSAGDNQIVTAVASNKIRVLSYVLVADAAEVVQWQDDAGANLSGTMSLAANGGIVAPFNPGGWFETASGQGLDLNNVGGADVDGHLSYIEVPA